MSSATTVSEKVLKNATFKRIFYKVLNSDNVDTLVNFPLNDIKAIIKAKYSYEDITSWKYAPPLNNMSILGWCGILDVADLAHLVIKKGCDCNFKLDEKGWTALHVATVCRSYSVMEELIQSSNCDINAKMVGPISALLLAIELDDVKGLKILLSNQALLLIQENMNQKYALIEAIISNSQKCFQELIEMDSVDINQVAGITFPLLSAVANNRIKMVRALVAKGADINKEFYNRTPLIVAASNGLLEIVKFLVKVNVNINYITKKHKRSALSAGIVNGKIEVVQFLTDNGANSNVTTMCANGQEMGLLCFAIHFGASYEIIKCILNSRQENVITEKILQLSLEMGNATIIAMICTKQNVSISCELKNKYILLCAAEGRLDLFKILLEQLEGNCNTENKDRRTPLMLASLNGHLDIVSYLIEYCDVNLGYKDIYGCIPLHYMCAAMDCQDLDMIQRPLNGAGCHEMLEEYMFTKNKKGQTPLGYAKNEALYRKIIKLCSVPKIIKPSESPAILPNEVSEEFIQSLTHFPNTAKQILDNCYQGIGFGIADPHFKIRVNISVFKNEAIKHVFNKQKCLLRHPVTQVYLHHQAKGFPKFLRCYAYVTFLLFALLYSHLLYFVFPSHVSKDSLKIENVNSELLELIICLTFVILYFLLNVSCYWYGIVLCGYWIFAILSMYTGNVNWVKLNSVGIVLAWLNFTLLFRSFSGVGLFMLMLQRVIRNIFTLLFPLLLFILAFTLLFVCLNAKFSSNIYSTMTTSFMKCLSLKIGNLHQNFLNEFFTTFLLIVCLALGTAIPCNLVTALIVSNVQAVRDQTFQQILELKAKESIVCESLTKELKIFEVYLNDFAPVFIQPYEKQGGLLKYLLGSSSSYSKVTRALTEGIKENVDILI